MKPRKPMMLAASALMVALVGGGVLSSCGKKETAGATTQSAGGPGGQQRPGGAGGPGGGPGGGRGGMPVTVVAAPVETREFVQRIEALGTLEPRERVELTANASDRITGLYFEDGQRVRKGATLLTLASEEERAQLDGARAAFAEAKRQLERNERLAAENAVSQLVLQSSTRDTENAEAQVRALEARLRDRVLVAPFDGVLGFRQVSLGAYVAPGAPIATLIDDREMRLEFTVPSIYGRELKPGLSIEGKTADLPGETFEGSLTSVDNAIDPVTRTVRVRATLPNATRRLKAGMFMTVQLSSSARMSLAAPEIAVIAEGSDTFVFLVDQSKKPAVAVKTPIRLGVREKGVVEVADGLKPGDMVVVEGVLKLRPNAPVMIQGQGRGQGPGQGQGGRPASGGPPAGGGSGGGGAPVAASAGPRSEAPGLVH